MATAQVSLAGGVIRAVPPGGHIAQVNNFKPGVVEFISTDTTVLNGVVKSAPETTAKSGIVPFFTHIPNSDPWKEYLIIPQATQVGDKVTITIDGADYTAILAPGTTVDAGGVKMDGDRIDQIVPGATLIPGAGDELGGPIVTVKQTTLAPGQRGLVVYEYQPPNLGGGKMFAINPNQASGIPLPAFRTVTTNPATGTLVGEAILNTTSGLSYVWDGLNWVAIVPPSIITYPTDTDILTDVTAVAGTYGFSQASGNLFVRFTEGATDKWREIGIRRYATETALIADTSGAQGEIAYAIDTRNYWYHDGTTWQPFGIHRDTEADIRASAPADGTLSYASDTGNYWLRHNGAWVPSGDYSDTIANIHATTTFPAGTRAYATDEGTLWHFDGTRWVLASVVRDTEANILALDPGIYYGAVAVADDLGKIYLSDGTQWLGQPFVSYATEALLLAANPRDGVLAVAEDTGTVHYRTAGGWRSISLISVPVGTTDPTVAAIGNLFFNTNENVAKINTNNGWESLGAPSQWAVGSIQQSLLDENQFSNVLPVTERGKWVLADGRDITGSAYAGIVGSNTLPDLRGAFLRMAGTNNNPQWVGGNLRGFQEDSTARPKTAFTTNNLGAHYHRNGKKEFGPQAELFAYGADALNTTGWVSNNEPRLPQFVAHTSNDGDHTHNITGGGDTETRPKNFSVNYFVKIN